MLGNLTVSQVESRDSIELAFATSLKCICSATNTLERTIHCSRKDLCLARFVFYSKKNVQHRCMRFAKAFCYSIFILAKKKVHFYFKLKKKTVFDFYSKFKKTSLVKTCHSLFAPRQKDELETLFQNKMHPSRSEKEMLSKLFGVPKRKIEVFDLFFCSMTEKFIYLDFFNCRQDRVNLFSLHYYCCSLY